MFGFNVILKLFCCALLSLFAVQWIYYRILKIAKIKHLEDVPDARKLQKAPTPVLGGIAVFFGLTAGVILAACLFPDAEDILPIMLSCMVMLYIGSIDDVLGISAGVRALIEALTIVGLIFGSGICIDSFHELWGIGSFAWYWAVPLTVFVGVGLVNAFNMIDGVNGLSSTLCIVCSVLLGIVFYKMSDPVDAALAFSFAGALLTFALHNIFGEKSRMFIGDGGTMTMGILVTWFVIRIMSSQGLANNQMDIQNMNTIAMLLAIVCVPVFDTLRVMVGRMIRHQSPFAPDKTHLHHMFISLGCSHFFTTICELCLNLLVTIVWYITYKAGIGLEGQLYGVLLAALFFIGGATFVLYYCNNHESICQRIRAYEARKSPKNKWWMWMEYWVDYRTYDANDSFSKNSYTKDKFR